MIDDIEQSIDDLFVMQPMDEVVVVEKSQTMESELEVIQAFVDKIKTSTSTNIKKEILEKDACPIVKRALVYAHNPFWKYHVTSKNCIKNDHLEDPNHTCLWTLCDRLTSRDLTGHDALAAVNGLINHYPDYQDLIFSVINKNLKTRVSETIINKIFPNLIPTFKVALANPFDAKRCDWATEDWYGSRKLDGVRCVVILDRKEDTIKAYSRVGNEFQTLQVVKDDLMEMVVDMENTTPQLKGRSWVFDGEVCLIDDDGNEDFQGVMKEINKKDHQMKQAKFVLFDMLTKGEFDERESVRTLSERGDFLQRIVFKGGDKYGSLSVLEQELIEDEAHISRLVDEADKAGFEGIMVRKDVGYEGKRSHNLLKVKKFHDAEYEVTDIESEVQRIIVNGKEVEELMMARANIEHKGSKVGVGSGWSKQQRQEYHTNPERLIGNTITVQYFEETTNKDGKFSLRFPTVKAVYENGRDF